MLEKKKIYKGLILRELLSLKYKSGELIIPAIASLTIFAIFLLILDSNIISNPTTLYGIILSISVVTVGLVDSMSIEDEVRAGVLEQLMLIPIKPIKIILIKYIFGLTKHLFINLVVWSLICQIVNVNFSSILIQYILFSIYLVSSSLLVSAINLSIKGIRNAFSIVLTIPLIFPQIILSILSITENTYIYLFLSLMIIMVPVFILFSTTVILNTISNS